MTMSRRINAKSASASIEAIEVKAKRMVQDLTLLKHEVREAERAGSSKRDFELIHSRVYMLMQSQWSIGDLISNFDEEVRAAMNTPEPAAQLRLTGGR